jgi:hypothetical protein
MDVVGWCGWHSLFDVEKEKVNGLYNYPSAPMTLGHLGQSQSNIEVTVWSILDGSAANEIDAAKRKYQDYAAELDQQKAATSSLTGAAKAQAEALAKAGEQSLVQQFVAYRQARDTYNEFRRQMQTYSFGAYMPRGLSSLGQTETVVLAIIGVAALAALASQLSSMISAMHGHEVNTRGILDQLAEVLKQLGALPQGIGVGVKDVAIGAAILLGVYIVFKVFQKRSGGSSPVTTAPAASAETQLAGAAA